MSALSLVITGAVLLGFMFLLAKLKGIYARAQQRRRKHSTMVILGSGNKLSLDFSFGRGTHNRNVDSADVS
jgi:hypothetical protein